MHYSTTYSDFLPALTGQFYYIVIIMGVCVLVGYTVDFFIKKSEAKKIHDFFSRSAKSMQGKPIRLLIERLANGFVGFFDQIFDLCSILPRLVEAEIQEGSIFGCGAGGQVIKSGMLKKGIILLSKWLLVVISIIIIGWIVGILSFNLAKTLIWAVGIAVGASIVGALAATLMASLAGGITIFIGLLMLLLGLFLKTIMPVFRKGDWERPYEYFLFSVLHPILLMGFGVFLSIIVFTTGKVVPSFVFLSAMMMLPFTSFSFILQFKKKRPRFFNFAKLMLISFILSSLFSFIILMASTCGSIPAAYGSPESPWFQATVEGFLLRKSGYWLLLLNYPFDFLTILISLGLLARITRSDLDLESMVRRRNWVILPAGIISVASSAALTTGLFTAIKIAEGSVPLNQVFQYGGRTLDFFGRAFPFFWTHIIRGSLPDAAQMVPADIHLLPLLLTTFVPVTVFMCALIVLSLSHYVFMPVIIRFFEVLGEKRDESPFKKLAILLGIWLNVVKLLIDYFVMKQ